MLPLEDIPKDLCRSLKGVFSDIDDTNVIENESKTTNAIISCISLFHSLNCVYMYKLMKMDIWSPMY